MAGVSSWIPTPFATMADSFNSAPPTNRKFDEGFILLGRKDEQGVLRPVGAFSAELFVMANAGTTAWQVDDVKAKLLRKDGTAKTPFELAIIPYTSYRKIQKEFESAVTCSNGEKMALPAPIFKYRIKPDFLSELSEMGLEIYAGSPEKIPAPVDDVKINLPNPPARTSRFERGVHYASQWMAWFLTLSVGVETALLFGLSFPAALLPFAAGYLAHRCAKDFAMFDLAEAIIRDTGWMFNAKYVWEGKLSFVKSLKTAVLFASIGLAVYLAGTGAWAGTLGLASWSALTTLGAPAGLVSGLSALAAGSFAATAGLATWMGLSYATRYFLPFSLFNTTIKATPEQVAVCKDLPFIDEPKQKGNEMGNKVDNQADIEKESNKADNAPSANKEPVDVPVLRRSQRIVTNLYKKAAETEAKRAEKTAEKAPSRRTRKIA